MNTPNEEKIVFLLYGLSLDIDMYEATGAESLIEINVGIYTDIRNAIKEITKVEMDVENYTCAYNHSGSGKNAFSEEEIKDGKCHICGGDIYFYYYLYEGFGIVKWILDTDQHYDMYKCLYDQNHERDGKIKEVYGNDYDNVIIRRKACEEINILKIIEHSET